MSNHNNHYNLTPPILLTIAGFDPSSGAGVTADIKTIAAHGCYGVACITAMTVQSTAGVRRVDPCDPALVSETLQELAADVRVGAVHIGMLGSGKVAKAVSDFLAKKKLANVVLDPILKSSSGTALLDRDGMRVLASTVLLRRETLAIMAASVIQTPSQGPPSSPAAVEK